MAHDFMIKLHDGEETAYFFGYCGGAMYRAFGCEEHDAGVSGDGWRGTIPYEEAKRGLERAVRIFYASGYPAPHRADGLKRFLALLEARKGADCDIYFG